MVSENTFFQDQRLTKFGTQHNISTTYTALAELSKLQRVIFKNKCHHDNYL